MQPRERRPEPDHSLWWQIALGGFLALLTHSIVTGLYANYQANRLLKEVEASMKEIVEPRTTRTTAPRVPNRSPYVAPTIDPLESGERCIQGRRFQRVENGWIHLPKKPC